MFSIGYDLVMPAVIVPAMVAACWSDLRRHRVPNWLNLSLAATGLMAQALFAGWPGLQNGLYGLLAGFSLLFVLWMMRAMGAGDVKFMAALGAWIGPEQTFYAVLAGGLIGGVIAAGMILYRRHWFQTWANLGVLLTKVGSVQTAFSEFGSAQSLGRTTGVLPYAVPLSVGTLLVLVCNYSGWWKGL